MSLVMPVSALGTVSARRCLRSRRARVWVVAVIRFLLPMRGANPPGIICWVGAGAASFAVVPRLASRDTVILLRLIYVGSWRDFSRIIVEATLGPLAL